MELDGCQCNSRLQKPTGAYLLVLDTRRDDLMVGEDRGNKVFVTGANDFVVLLRGELENLQTWRS